MNSDIVNGEQTETCRFKLDRDAEGHRWRIYGRDDLDRPFQITFSDLWASELVTELTSG